MGKHSKKASNERAATTGQPKPVFGWGWLILGFLLCIVGFFFGQSRGASYADPAPFGTALPEIPVAITYRDVDSRDVSIIEGRAPFFRLDEVAPEPDGLPPLSRTYVSSIGDFKLPVTQGAEISMFSPEYYQQDGVEGSIVFHYDNPIHGLQVTFVNRNEDERVHEYVARLRHELEADEVVFYPDTEPVILDNYRFEHFEYYRPTGVEGTNSFQTYFGPLGPRVLVINFMTSPEHHELAKPLVQKIIAAFAPGPRLLEIVSERDPHYLGKAQAELPEADDPPKKATSADDRTPGA